MSKLYNDTHERAADEMVGDLLIDVDAPIANRIHKRLALALAKLELAESRGAQSRPDSSVGSSGSQDRKAWAGLLEAAKSVVKAGVSGPDNGVANWHDWAGNMLRVLRPLQEALYRVESLNVQPEPSQDAGQGDGRCFWVTESVVTGYPSVVHWQGRPKGEPLPGWRVVRYVPESTVPSQAAGGWLPLFDDDGAVDCDEGNEYLFAAGHTFATDERKVIHWQYFTDAIIWDSETEPHWADGGHGFELGDVSHYRPKPTAPEKP